MDDFGIDEKKIALELNINHRNFVITVDKKVYEKDENGKLQECLEEDKDVQLLSKYLKPPKSLDVF